MTEVPATVLVQCEWATSNIIELRRISSPGLDKLVGVFGGFGELIGSSYGVDRKKFQSILFSGEDLLEKLWN